MANGRVTKAAASRSAATTLDNGAGLGTQVGASSDTSLIENGPDPKSVKGAMLEYGATGLRQFSGYVREEWLRDLTGWRGIRIYREMRDNDAVIGAMFFAVEMLLRSVHWRVEGATEEPADQQAADFINSCMSDMEFSWPEFICEVLTFMHFGWDIHEIVYKRRQGATDDPTTNSKYADGMIGWRKFAGRAQETLLHWEFDASGAPTAMVQLLPTGGPLLRVPLAKALHFRTSVQKNNPEGRSLLRNCYRAWYYKKRLEELEAIGIEREMCGLPIVWIPQELLSNNATAAQRAQLAAFQSIARDVVRNEQAGLVMPLVYVPTADGSPSSQKAYDITLLTSGGRRQIDISPAIDRYDQRISSTLLADFIMLGGSKGSYALSRNKTDMFTVTIKAFLEIICAEFNHKAIPDLLRLNGMTGSAKLTTGDIARRDLAELGQFLSQLAAVGLITPDDVTEEAIREEADLPPLAENSLRGSDGEEDPDGGKKGNGSPDDEEDGAVDDTSGENVTRDRTRGQGQNPGASASSPSGGIVKVRKRGRRRYVREPGWY